MTFAFWLAAAMGQVEVVDRAAGVAGAAVTVGSPLAERARLRAQLSAAGMSDAGIAAISRVHGQPGETDAEAALFASTRAAEARWNAESRRALPIGADVVAAARDVRTSYRALMDALIARREAIIGALAPADLRIYLDTIGRSEEGLLLGTR